MSSFILCGFFIFTKRVGEKSDIVSAGNRSIPLIALVEGIDNYIAGGYYGWKLQGYHPFKQSLLILGISG